MDVISKKRIKSRIEIINDKPHIYVVEELEIEFNNSDFEHRVKTVAAYNNITLGEVAQKFGVAQGTLLVRCRNGKLTFEEQHRLAEILGCKLEINFTFEDGAIYKAKNVKKLINEACAHIQMTQVELGDKLGKSKQAFSSRLINGKFTDSELTEIANKIGCKYENYFILENNFRV